jgi:hypothetical protein
VEEAMDLSYYGVGDEWDSLSIDPFLFGLNVFLNTDIGEIKCLGNLARSITQQMIVYWVINLESIFPSIRRNIRKPSTIVFGIINLRLSLQQCLPWNPEILCKDSCF